MRSALIVFGILLVLLLIISTLGGSIRPKREQFVQVQMPNRMQQPTEPTPPQDLPQIPMELIAQEHALNTDADAATAMPVYQEESIMHPALSQSESLPQSQPPHGSELDTLHIQLEAFSQDQEYALV